MMEATTARVVLGCIAYAIFWLLAVFPAQPLLPIGRTAGSLLSATLMVAFQVVNPDEAYAAIDLPILGLLFGTMLVGAYLERADMFKYLAQLLQWRSHGGRDLLCRVCAVAALSSALFTNDTVCVVLTEFVLKIARQNNLPPEPFLLALASSANIGSAATPIGNPQNLIIAIQSRISFRSFLSGILPAMLLGVTINTAILLCFYWHQLSTAKNVDGGISCEPLVLNPLSEEEAPPPAQRRLQLVLWKASVYAVTLGMLAALLLGLNMSWSAMAAAVALMVVDFRDASGCLDKVSYSLLVFFCGMFISVDGFNRTGIPGALWDAMEPFARLDSARGMLLLSLAILLLSNVASNVPTVLLLGARVAASAAPEEQARAWLVMAWVSTVAGNLSLLGSAANLIVCEQARRSQSSAGVGYTLSFWRHLRFGLPTALLVTAIGLPLIRNWK